MSSAMPVKLSGELVEGARTSAKRFHRSLTSQIEHWATIGRAVESQLSGEAVERLLVKLDGPMRIHRANESKQRREVVDAINRFLLLKSDDGSWLQELSEQGIPLYGSEPGQAGIILRRNPDGTKEPVTLASNMGGVNC